MLRNFVFFTLTLLNFHRLRFIYKVKRLRCLISICLQFLNSKMALCVTFPPISNFLNSLHVCSFIITNVIAKINNFSQITFWEITRLSSRTYLVLHVLLQHFLGFDKYVLAFLSYSIGITKTSPCNKHPLTP